MYTNANISESEIKRLEYLKKQYINMSKVAMGKAIGAVLPKARTQCYIDLYTVNRKDIISRIENNTKKTIIFTPFLDVAHFICDDLNKNKVGCVKVVGETKNRMDVLVDFKTNDDIDVLVATTQTLSTGVTLTEATLMLFFGTPYRSADFNQACDRIHRIGQTNDVYIYKVLLDSPEKNVTERINEILGWSEDMFDSMIGNTGLNESMDLYVLEDIFESSRALLPDEAFGVSDLRKFPLDTEKHVRSAIKFFNYVDKEHEKELASKIIKKMKEYNITDIKISKKNRLINYLNTSIDESYESLSEDVNILEIDDMHNFARRTKDALKTILNQALPSLRDNFSFDIESDDGGYFFAWYKNIDDDIITQIVTALNGALDESPYRVSIKASSNGGIFWLYQPSERTVLIDENVNDILSMIV